MAKKSEIKTSEIEMEVNKLCKGTIRFTTEEESVAVTNVYVDKDMPGIEDAKKIKVTVEIV